MWALNHGVKKSGYEKLISKKYLLTSMWGLNHGAIMSHEPRPLSDVIE